MTCMLYLCIHFSTIRRYNINGPLSVTLAHHWVIVSGFLGRLKHLPMPSTVCMQLFSKCTFSDTVSELFSPLPGLELPSEKVNLHLRHLIGGDWDLSQSGAWYLDQLLHECPLWTLSLIWPWCMDLINTLRLNGKQLPRETVDQFCTP